MREGVTKKQLVASLAETLKLTREGVADLELKDESTVVIYYRNGYKKEVNIECNSGQAIIYDVTKKVTGD